MDVAPARPNPKLTTGHRLCVVATLLFAILALTAAFLPTGALAKGANVIKGTNEAERLVGTKKSDRILARGGNDRVSGKNGNDKLVGGRGKDKLKGGRGKDKLKGGKGKDKLKGGGGADRLIGGGGTDAILGGARKDKLIGGGGNDTIDAVDGGADAKVAGGGGNDTCRVDPEDVANTSGCEDVDVVGGDPGPDPGPDPAPNAPLAISQSSFDCPTAPAPGTPATCSFSLAGTGADAAGGNLLGSAGIADVVGSITGLGNGTWTASGTANCSGPGELHVTIGSESDAVPVDCPSSGDVDLSVTSTTFECLPAVAPLPAVCTFLLNGAGADQLTGTVTGGGGVAGVVGVAASVAGGTWTATGTATCTADGILHVSFGDESVDAPVECATLGGGGDNGPLTLTSTNFDCLPAIPPLPAVCTFLLNGEGADESAGAITGGGGVAGVVGVAASVAGGAWTATGTATCTADGILHVSFGAESLDAPVECATLGGGGGDNGPLTLTSTNFECLPAIPPLPAVCTILLTGEGADESAGAITGGGGVAGVAGVAASVAGGTWTATGTATCTADGILHVSFGDESVDAPVECATLGGGGGGGGDPLTVSATNFTCLPPILFLPSVCTFLVSGEGADEPTGSIAAGGGVANVVGVATGTAGGAWTGSGTATCTSDGLLHVVFGSESVDADVSCG